MVDLGRVNISYEGIEEQIDAAERFERQRGGTIDPGYRERVRRAIIQARALQVTTEQRLGRDVESAAQQRALSERDQRRRVGTPQKSREQLRQEGKLAGSRGAEGITRTPSKITGFPSAAGARGGFRGDRPRAEFESRQEVIRRQAKRELRPRIQQAYSQKFDTSNLVTRTTPNFRGETRVISQTMPLFERPAPVSPRFLTPVRRRISPQPGEPSNLGGVPPSPPQQGFKRVPRYFYGRPLPLKIFGIDISKKEKAPRVSPRQTKEGKIQFLPGITSLKRIQGDQVSPFVGQDAGPQTVLEAADLGTATFETVKPQKPIKPSGKLKAGKPPKSRDVLTPLTQEFKEFSRRKFEPRPGDSSLGAAVKRAEAAEAGFISVPIGIGEFFTRASKKISEPTKQIFPTPVRLGVGVPALVKEVKGKKQQIVREPGLSQQVAEGTFGLSVGELGGEAAFLLPAPPGVGVRVPVSIGRRPVRLSTSKGQFETVRAGSESARVTVFETIAESQTGEVAIARVRGVQRGVSPTKGVLQQQSRLETQIVKPSGKTKVLRTVQSGRQVDLGGGKTRIVISGTERSRFGVPKTFVTRGGIKESIIVDDLSRSLIGGETYQRRLGGLVRPKKVSKAVGVSKEELKTTDFILTDSGQLRSITITQGQTKFFGFTPQKRVTPFEVFKKGEGVRVPKPKSTKRRPSFGDVLPKGRKGSLGTSRQSALTLETPKIKTPKSIQKDFDAAFDIAAAEKSRRSAERALPLRSRFKIKTRRISKPKSVSLAFGTSAVSKQFLTPETVPKTSDIQIPGIVARLKPSQLPKKDTTIVPKIGTRTIPTITPKLTPRQTPITTPSITPITPPFNPVFGRPGPSPPFIPIPPLPPGGFLRPGRRSPSFLRRPKARRQFSPSLFGKVLAEKGFIIRQKRGTNLPGFLVRGEGPGFRFTKKAKPKKKRSKSKKVKKTKRGKK